MKMKSQKRRWNRNLKNEDENEISTTKMEQKSQK